MDIHDFQQIEENLVTITPDDVAGLGDRTLLMGVQGSGSILHIYLLDNQIHRMIYNADDSDYSYTSYTSILPQLCVPQGGKVWPERSDFDFCRALKVRATYLNFEEFNHDVPSIRIGKGFYGRILKDFVQPDTSDIKSMEEAGRYYMRSLGEGLVLLSNNETKEQEVWMFNKHIGNREQGYPRIAYRNSILNFMRLHKTKTLEKIQAV